MLTLENIYQQPLFKFEGEEIYFHNLSVSSNAKKNFLNNTQNQIKNVKSFIFDTEHLSAGLSSLWMC